MTGRRALLYRAFGSPVGPLVAVVHDDGAIAALLFLRDGDAEALAAATTGRYADIEPDRAGRSAAVERQVAEYFAGVRRRFDLPLAPHGTPFQLEVWNALRAIPFGTTTSYAELARSIGRPDAARAVGRANGVNPIAIVVPCHRVVGSNGALTGYGGGLHVKRLLLEHEGALPTPLL